MQKKKKNETNVVLQDIGTYCGQISAFKYNFGPICGQLIYNTLLYTIYTPQIGHKLRLKAEIKKKNFPTTFFWFTFDAPPKL